MAASFHFKYDGNFTATFYSTEREAYTVKLTSGPSAYCALHFTLEWKYVSSKIINVSTCYSNSSELNFHKTLFVKNCRRADTTIKNPNNCGYACTIIIVVATCTDLIKFKPPLQTATVQTLTPTKVEPKVEKKLERLSADMTNLLETGNLSDVVLTDGAKEIHAHKLILSTRSSVFAKMFQHPMKESHENRITIKDISHEVLLQLLRFIYAGTVVIKDSSMARELYVAADKYDVKDLRDICSTMLKSVDLDSALDTLLLADLYSDKVLKEAALNFISKNYSLVKALQKWSSFMKKHQDLAIEILSFVIDKKN